MSFHRPLRAAAGAVAALALAAAPAGAAPQRFTNRAVAAAAPAPAAAVYGGHTASQFDPIGLEVSRAGRLKSAVLHVETTCDNGDGYSWSGPAAFAARLPATPGDDVNVFAPGKVSRSGAFAAKGRVVADYGDTVGDVSETIAGRLRGGKARGTLEATIDVSDQASGQHVTTCRTGRLRWTARSAPGRVFAGLTSQGRPVVVEEARSGRKVSTFWITYGADCRSGAGFAIGEGLSNFPITDGDFGDRWTDEERGDAGGEAHVEYRLAGHAGRTRAAGLFQAQETDTDASGTTTDECDSTVIAWSARSTKGRAPAVRPEVRRVGG